MKKILYLLIFFQFGFAHFSQTISYTLMESDQKKEECIWEEVNTVPFNELIVSWNANRDDTRYSFFISLLQDGNWSEWLFYADWGSGGQFLLGESPQDSLGETYRGVARPKKGLCNGFKIHMISCGPSHLSGLKKCSATLSNLTEFKPTFILDGSFKSVLLTPVIGQSLLTLRHPRYNDMSMSASTLTAIRYLLKKEISADEFLQNVMDGDFDCFDHWPLHTAEAFHRLEGKFEVRIERLEGFADLHSYLIRGLPVLVDILGTPMGGIPCPPYRRHVLCVIGYEAEKNQVICIDPIFPNNKATQICYPLDSFLMVWAKRENLAAVFDF